MKKIYVLNFEYLTFDKGTFDGYGKEIFLNKKDAELKKEYFEKECKICIGHPYIEEREVENVVELNKEQFEQFLKWQKGEIIIKEKETQREILLDGVCANF